MASIAGERNFLEIHEAANKVIQCLRVFNDPRDAAREVEIEFADGTELSIEIQTQTVILTRLCRLEDGDFDVIKEYANTPDQSR
jgi:hypothetical protein